MAQPFEIRDDLDDVLAALANRHRRAIVYALGLQPYSISQLAHLRDLSLPAIHKHLAILEDAGLVRRRKTGRTTYLTLRRDSLASLQSWLMQFQPSWGTDQETLANYEPFLTENRSTTAPFRNSTTKESS
jgi:DNA-binding transcriptional ArsR family regulator